MQQHAKMSAAVGQARSIKAYLNQFSQVMRLLALWSAEFEMSLQDGYSDMSEETKGYELSFLEFKLKELSGVRILAQIIFSGGRVCLTPGPS